MSARRDGRRVVVTGAGLYSPVGNSVDELVGALEHNVSGIRRMPAWDDCDGLRTRLAGVCPAYAAERIPAKARRKMGGVTVLACLAAQDAVAAAGLEATRVAGRRCGVSFGSSAGSPAAQSEYFERYFADHSFKGIPASSYLRFMSHTCAASIAVLLHCRGPVVASSTACVSGSQGIGFGYEQIRLGRADAMLCGGAEEMHPMVAAIFDRMGTTSRKYNDRPQAAPRPFDAERDGLVVGEGAGCLVLEDYDHARRRGAPMLAEIGGFATSSDGWQYTNADPDGLVVAVEDALADAGLAPADIGYINAHATATRVGDRAESIASHRLFGARVPVSSLKGHIGHTLGAAGAIEAIATIEMLRRGFVAPTLNLEQPDPDCAPLDHVQHEPRPLSFSVAMSNNFAFGGINTSIVLRRID